MLEALLERSGQTRTIQKLYRKLLHARRLVKEKRPKKQKRKEIEESISSCGLSIEVTCAGWRAKILRLELEASSVKGRIRYE